MQSVIPKQCQAHTSGGWAPLSSHSRPHTCQLCGLGHASLVSTLSGNKWRCSVGLQNLCVAQPEGRTRARLRQRGRQEQQQHMQRLQLQRRGVAATGRSAGPRCGGRAARASRPLVARPRPCGRQRQQVRQRGHSRRERRGVLRDERAALRRRRGGRTGGGRR